jgi:hypothetical protein
MEFLSMNKKEIDRVTLLTQVKAGLLTQVKAGELLGISDRQVRNLLIKLEKLGPKGIISQKRGKPSNRQTKTSSKGLILRIIQEHYEDFGPTLAIEKLKEHHHIVISRETLRKWLIEAHLWTPKVKKRTRHLLRKRREFFGEMIQGDGSHHDWFENDHPCVLLIFIDDATSKITAARFEEAESLDGYFEILRQHLVKYGRPTSLYTDHFSVFESSLKKENLTQFQRALKVLGIKWIGANSPQAKGRVERCNRTLQDRLIKEMRIRNIKSIREGNAFLEEYLADFNDKFSKEPMKLADLHRPLERGIDLSRTLSKYEERTLTKDLTFQFHNTHYKISEPIKGIYHGTKIELRSDRNGNFRGFIGNKELKFSRLDEIIEPECKIINLAWSTKHVEARKSNHPWKHYCYAKHQREEEIKRYTRV